MLLMCNYSDIGGGHQYIIKCTDAFKTILILNMNFCENWEQFQFIKHKG